MTQIKQDLSRGFIIYTGQTGSVNIETLSTSVENEDFDFVQVETFQVWQNTWTSFDLSMNQAFDQECNGSVDYSGVLRGTFPTLQEAVEFALTLL